MKPHVKIYTSFFGIGEQDKPICEWCNRELMVDVHHIEMKGMGGNDNLDYIENLVGICRNCHVLAHQSPEENENMKELAEDINYRIRRMNRVMYGKDGI